MSALRTREGNARADDSFTCSINVAVDGKINEGLGVTVDGQIIRMLDRDSRTSKDDIAETIMHVATDMVRNYSSPYVLGESFSSTDMGTGHQSKKFKALGTGGKSSAALQPNTFPILQHLAATDTEDTKRRKTSSFVHRALSAPCAILISPSTYELNLVFYTPAIPRFAVIRHGLLIGATPIGSTLSRNVHQLEQGNKCAPVVLLNAFPHTSLAGISCDDTKLKAIGYNRIDNSTSAAPVKADVDAMLPAVMQIIANFCGICPLHSDITDCKAGTCNFDIVESALIDGVATEMYSYMVDESNPYDPYLFHYIHLTLFIAGLEHPEKAKDAHQKIYNVDFHTKATEFAAYIPALERRDRSYQLKRHIFAPKRKYFDCIDRARRFLANQNGTDAKLAITDATLDSHKQFMAAYALADPHDAGYIVAP